MFLGDILLGGYYSYVKVEKRCAAKKEKSLYSTNGIKIYQFLLLSEQAGWPGASGPRSLVGGGTSSGVRPTCGAKQLTQELFL